MNKRKEIIASFILIGIFICLSFIPKYVSLEKAMSSFIAYLFFVLFIIVISSKFPYKFLIKFRDIVAFPLGILYFLLKFILPFGSIFMGIIINVALVIFPIIILSMLNDYFKIITISKENFTFITLTFLSIASIIFYKYIVQLNRKFLIHYAAGSYSKLKELIRLKALVEYVITPMNIRFFIYSSYFIYLGIFSFNYLENDISFASKSHYTAIMQSFMTFVAFDSLRINSKEVKFLPSILLNKILKSFLADMNSFEKKEKKKVENIPSTNNDIELKEGAIK